MAFTLVIWGATDVCWQGNINLCKAQNTEFAHLHVLRTECWQCSVSSTVTIAESALHSMELLSGCMLGMTMGRNGLMHLWGCISNFYSQRPNIKCRLLTPIPRLSRMASFILNSLFEACGKRKLDCTHANTMVLRDIAFSPMVARTSMVNTHFWWQ